MSEIEVFPIPVFYIFRRRKTQHEMDERASDERDGFQIGGAESLLVDYDQALDISATLHDVVYARLRPACGFVVASRVKLKEIPKSDSL